MSAEDTIAALVAVAESVVAGCAVCIGDGIACVEPGGDVIPCPDCAPARAALEAYRLSLTPEPVPSGAGLVEALEVFADPNNWVIHDTEPIVIWAPAGTAPWMAADLALAAHREQEPPPVVEPCCDETCGHYESCPLRRAVANVSQPGNPTGFWCCTDWTPRDQGEEDTCD